MDGDRYSCSRSAGKGKAIVHCFPTLLDNGSWTLCHSDSHTHAHTSDEQSVGCYQTFRGGEVVPAGEGLPACTCKESGRESEWKRESERDSGGGGGMNSHRLIHIYTFHGNNSFCWLFFPK